ncbi:MAG: MBL fold metallo-hydrolase [Anaerolineae bacterium]|nr:MBL fold metallo-hydrolase [Anaerolineae bacterium]
MDNAFPREFGCNCPRCLRPERAANTSVSLIGTDGDRTAFHALIDCGHGISDSLAANPLLHGDQARLDWIVLTHWHSDHSIELGRIGAGWIRTCARRGQPFARIPVWCREGSAQWLAHEQPNPWRTFADPVVAPGFDGAGVVLDPVPIQALDLYVTPITLHHSSADVAPDDLSRRQPSCAGLVIQTPERKAVLFWDMDNTNTWMTEPQTEAHRAALVLAQQADVLCVDCNTWRFAGTATGKPASHASFHTQLQFVRALAPRETLLMHLSGHEDERGDGFGWLDSEWHRRAQEAWQAQSMPGSVRVPHIGERIVL